MLLILVILLVSSLVTGVYFTMNKSTPVQVSSISPESKLDLKVPPTSPVVKPQLETLIPGRPVDCVDKWGEWSPCSATSPVVKPQLETLIPGRPVDCVGKWGEWSPCSVGSIECELNSDGEGGIPPIGVQKRNWITLKKAKNGGKACVYDINKDGFKACKGVCNKDVQICYSCGYKNCKVFKIGSGADVSGAAPLNGVTSIKVPYGRKIDFLWRDPEGRVAPPQRVVEETGADGNFEFSPCTPIQIVGLRISKK